MKKFYLLTAAIAFMAGAVSCSSGGDDAKSAIAAKINNPNLKIVQAASPAFTEGGLSRFVEIVEGPTDLTYVNDTTKSGMVADYSLKVKVRVKQENKSLANVDADDIAFTSKDFWIGLRGLTLVLKDDDNVTLNKNDYFMVADDDVAKLKKLLKSSKGTEETLTFVYSGSPELFNEAVSYAPAVTASLSKTQLTKGEN